MLDFVRRVENLSLPEAIARRPKSAALAPRDPTLLTAAGRFYAGQLRRSPTAWEYLTSRGVGLAAAARLGLGYAPGSGLRLALESCGFSEKRIQDSGLFMERGAERFAGAGRAIGPRQECRQAAEQIPAPARAAPTGPLGVHG